MIRFVLSLEELQEMRAPNSLSHGNASENNLKDGWRLDGTHEKRDWRRSGPEVEIRRWREEERDTGLLGRRDRRADTVSSKDISESRSSSDRWNDSINRNTGPESRKDNKWSSRWSPEDKEKDSRTEKRIGVEKEDSYMDKQSVASGSRPTSERENDSRDKWRPRHRMEVNAGGSHKSATGLGLERGRAEGPVVGFAAGRGRPKTNGNLQMGRFPSASAIGFASIEKNLPYLYPRGKLLDIYRKQKNVPDFDTVPDGMEQVSSITQKDAVEPMAFVVPDADEEVQIT